MTAGHSEDGSRSEGGWIFRDRSEAGRALARLLRDDLPGDSPLVLALPRGGVEVAEALARELGVPWDLLMVRTLRLPGQEEFTLGAIAPGGVRVLSPAAEGVGGVAARAVAEIVAQEMEELECSERRLRGSRGPVQVEGRTVILVDDGLVTGATMLAAARALRARGPARIVVAVPVAPPSARERLSQEVDAFLCLASPRPFGTIDHWYGSFPKVTDARVRALLGEGSPNGGAPGDPS